MISNWDKSFDMVIAHEGGFTNDERDPVISYQMVVKVQLCGVVLRQFGRDL